MLKTIREATVGKAMLRLVQTAKGFSGIVSVGQDRKALEEGDDADDVWRRLHHAATRLNPLFVDYAGARARFLHFFPDGFSSEEYLEKERRYKLGAKEILEKAAPLAIAAEGGQGLGEAVLSAYRANTLLSPFEKTRMQDVLRGPAADDFIGLAAAFTLGDGKASLAAMKRLLKPYDSAKWTVITYLPFFWKPESHVFLKPTMIRTFAERVGHAFAEIYRPDLDVEVYASLLDLAKETKARIADLGPRDMIDIQSFMWTAVEYTEEDRTTAA